MLSSFLQSLIEMTWLDWSVVLIVSIPLSMFLYLANNKYQHDMLIDLGQHKWIINHKDK